MPAIPHPGLAAPLLAEASLPLPTPLAVALFFAGLAGYALVNAVEIAIVAANRMRIRAAAEGGSRRAAAVDRLKGEQEVFFGAVVVLQNVFVFLVSAAGTVIAVDLFGGWGFLFSLIAVPLVTTEFGEYTPKVLASRAAERIALLSALPVQALVLVMRPLIRALAVVPNLFSSAGSAQTVTEAELRMLIGIGAEEGAVGEEEAELLDRVFHFHDRRVNEIMIPRTEVVWLERDETVRDFYRTFDQTPHSRFPVYADTVDNVVGIVSIKNVLRALAEGQVGEDSSIAPLIRPATFVPETKLISQLFLQLQEERQQMAVVVDEYGGVAGVVSLEMLLEEMVGSVGDEMAPPEPEFAAIDEHTTRVDGGMSIHDVREELELNLPEGDYETVAGFVLDRLGHIPREGETVALDGYRLTVSDVQGVKIESVDITKL
ncbi:MAG: hemolysin family protein [Dehalococcoidia bacterium]